jgi:hypothetical protein
VREWLPLVSTAISVLSLCVACFAVWNGRLARIDAKKSALFELKMKALLAAKTCEAEWQGFMNELYHSKQRLASIGRESPAMVQVFQYFSQVEGFLQDALENSKQLTKPIDDNFETCTEELARTTLKVREASNISMTRSREEMRKKLALLEGAIAKKIG